MDQLFQIKPSSLWYYVSPFIGSLIVRVITSYIRFREADKVSRPLFWDIFKGEGYREDMLKPPIAADYGVGYFLGVFELFAYPILLRSQNAIYIGAWLTFKTVHRWGYAPKYERGTFNRYLFANALILFFSYIIGYFWVDP